MSSAISFTSERLHFRRLVLEDAPFLLELLNSRGWIQYIGDRGVRDIAGAEEYLRNRIFPNYSNPVYGPYLAIFKEDLSPTGVVGIYQRPGLEIPDLGFAFLDQFQRKGFGKEASIALLSFAADVQVSAPAKTGTSLSAITSPDNLRSQQLLKSLGFRQNGQVQLPDDTQCLDYWINEQALDPEALKALKT